MSASAISDVIRLDKASVTEMLGRLTARGLITKSRDPADGRRRSLQLTTEGRDTVLRLAPAVEAVEAAFLSPLDPARQVAFRVALDRLAVAALLPVPLDPSVDPIAG